MLSKYLPFLSGLLSFINLPSNFATICYNETLCFLLCSNIKLVTTEMKSGMAASLVSLYPLFKDETDPLKRSWVGITLHLGVFLRHAIFLILILYSFSGESSIQPDHQVT